MGSPGAAPTSGLERKGSKKQGRARCPTQTNAHRCVISPLLHVLCSKQRAGCIGSTWCMQKGFHVLILPRSHARGACRWLFLALQSGHSRFLLPKVGWAHPPTQPHPTASTGLPVLGLPTEHLLHPSSAGLDGAMGPDDALGLVDAMG